MGRIVTMAVVGLALAGSCTVSREQPNLVGQDVRVTLIHTSDIHSRLFPYDTVPNRFDQGYGLVEEKGPFGGIARMTTLIKRERAKANRSLWLDSGDCFQGAPVFNMFKGEAEVRSLSLAGMDAAVVGNHEFDLGATNLIKQIDDWAQYPFLAANYVFDDPPNPDQRGLRDVFEPYVIFDLDGVRFGIIGMANWSSMTGIFEGGNSLGIRPILDAQVVTEYVRLLRPAVDVVVLLSHLGLDEDEGLASDKDALDGVDIDSIPIEGVDLILGGHLHIVLNPPKVLTQENGDQTILVHSGAFAKYFGRLDLVVKVGSDNSKPETRSKIAAFSYDNIPVMAYSEQSTIADPDPVIPAEEVTNLLWPYSVALNREIDLDGVFAFTCKGAEGGCSDKVLRNDLGGGDSQLGNLVARSMQVRSGVEAELAITNSLGVRADFEPGALTIEQMFNVFPFENSITVMYLSGSEIQETLNFVARKSASRGCRTQAQVSGIFWDMVCDGDCPNGDTACARDIVIGEDCRVNGDPDADIDKNKCPEIEPSGLYRVAVNDYISRGGSGFEVLKRNSSKQDTGVSLRDALIDFIRTQGSCCSGDANGCSYGTTDLCEHFDFEGKIDSREVCPGDADANLCGGELVSCYRRVADEYGEIACLRDFEEHDGRIRAIFD